MLIDVDSITVSLSSWHRVKSFQRTTDTHQQTLLFPTKQRLLCVCVHHPDRGLGCGSARTISNLYFHINKTGKQSRQTSVSPAEQIRSGSGFFSATRRSVGSSDQKDKEKINLRTRIKPTVWWVRGHQTSGGDRRERTSEFSPRTQQKPKCSKYRGGVPRRINQSSQEKTSSRIDLRGNTKECTRVFQCLVLCCVFALEEKFSEPSIFESAP